MFPPEAELEVMYERYKYDVDALLLWIRRTSQGELLILKEYGLNHSPSHLVFYRQMESYDYYVKTLSLQPFGYTNSETSHFTYGRDTYV